MENEKKKTKMENENCKRKSKNEKGKLKTKKKNGKSFIVSTFRGSTYPRFYPRIKQRIV